MKFCQAAVCVCMCLFLQSFPARAELDIELLTGDFDLERIDALVAENVDDPALVFDLLGLKADKEADQGNFLTAAETTATQAALAVRFPDQIASDLPALYWDAAEFYRLADAPELALEQLYAALEALRERAANRALLADLLHQIADLENVLGRTETAAKLHEQAEALPAPLDAPPPTRSNDPGYVNVDVYYATDRARTGRSVPSRYYGYGRASGLDYGIANVTIPKTHEPGTVAAPSVWRLEFSEDPAKHVMLQSIEPMDRDSFFASMRNTLAQESASDAFVFVHGYNVSFDAAAKRTAQLAYDMNFKGLPILYSWPSRGATVGYIPDTAVVRLSGRRLTRFLEDIVDNSGARTIHIIAHSMGNRAVTDALELMALRRAPVETPVFDQVIFAAPDVDQGLFAEMVSTIRPLARRLTLYASEQDWALEASRKLHGNAPRAGQGGANVLSNENIDTIDMTGLGEDMLAHSYVSNDQSAILDISTLFWRNPDPDERCGIHARPDTAKIWEYKESACSSVSLLNVIGSLRNAKAYSQAQVRTTLQRDFGSEPQVKAFETLLLKLADD